MAESLSSLAAGIPNSSFLSSNTASALGTDSALMDIMSQTATSEKLDTVTKKAIMKSGGSRVKQSEVTLQQSQPTVTPAASVSNVEMPRDAYRYGKENAGVEDNLKLPRTLAAEEAEEEIATISLTTEVNLVKNKKESFEDVSRSSARTEFFGDKISSYSRFFLQNVAEAEQEKYQVVETFTAFYAFFYGKRPPIYRYTGILMNDGNHKWTNDMKFFYENFFRGTRAAEAGAQVVLTYSSKIVTGFLVDMQIQELSDLNKGAPFSFSMLVVDHVPIKLSADINELIERKNGELQSMQKLIDYQRSIANPSADALSSAQKVCAGVQSPSSVIVSGVTNAVKSAISWVGGQLGF